MQVRNGIFVAAALGWVGVSGVLPAQAHSAPPKAVVIKTAADAYNAAWQLWNKGDASKVEELLLKQVEQFPTDERLSLFLAASVASHAPSSEAEVYLSRVVELGAKAAKPTTEALAAQHFLHLSDPDSANEAFVALTELTRNNNKNPVLLWLYAQAAERMERPEQAEKAFRALLKKTHNAPAVVRQGFADALEAQGKHFYALDQRLKVAAVAPTPWTLHALSNNLTTLARYSEAAEVAALATKKFPQTPQGWHDLGVATTAMHRTELASTHFGKAAQLAQESSEKFDAKANLAAWASCLESQKKYGEAAEKYRQLAALQGVSAEQVRDANLRARAAEMASSGILEMP
jgi:Flp pilus assembly protein TadD